ncbi:hypothetical protein QWY31_09560 [Cytophagales bacterium LB-30]|uniref:Uncharacterized protein n=1 Tax=Shiella aurantiaca TaxID=3058365 RepID=A0ABT8F646_9BACT|nr:hypothetical protein [Shiella aurantiaca]MDN4165749.1 hypothetical protein [Shiella aurantiaca]
METKAKIRINLDTREFEIEGTEEFINSHANKIESFLGTITKISGSEKKAAAPAKAALATPAKRGRKPAAAKAAVAKAVAPKAAAPKATKAEVKSEAAPAAKPVANKVTPAKVAKPAKAAKVAKPKVVKEKKAKAVKAVKKAAPKAPKAKATNINVTEFAGFYKRVPKDAKDIDKLLAASMYAQSQDGVKFFTAKDLNTLLNSQGVKLSNPAQYIKNSVKSKRMSQVARGKFKLSDEGVTYVNGFLSK